MDLANHQQDDYQNQHNPNSGLLRFRSAPSSFLSSHPMDSLESDRLFSRFMGSNNTTTNNDVDDSSSLNFPNFEQKSSTLMVTAAGGGGDNIIRTCGGTEYSVASSPMYCRSELPPQYPKQSSYGDVSSMRNSNLVRQSSSPAGFFSQLNVHNGYAAIRTGNLRKGNGINEGHSPSLNGLKDQINFSSGLPSSMGLLSRISEIGTEGIDENSEDVKPENNDIRLYGTGFPVSSWNDSTQFVENDGKLFSTTQNGLQGTRPRILSHHLSLPKTSIEMAAMEKLFQFQDSVPCKIRAKRGCATHPRSIAERVRRTKISERMRKLQDLVPNMDKQTNTSDMLDLAVDYIKDLQRQFKMLSDTRARCKCSSTHKSTPNQSY